MSYTHRRSLPPEIWSQIIGEVPKPHLPKLLGLCSLFHDVVIRFLFSAIKIYFIEGDLACEMLNTVHPEWIEEITAKLVSKSWEILNHICQEPRFAKIVKSVTVIAFADGQSMFEKCRYTFPHPSQYSFSYLFCPVSLSNALLFLPNLQTFRWIGYGPHFDETVAECIPPNLKTFVVQSCVISSSLKAKR